MGDGIMEIRGGDISCIFDMDAGVFEAVLNRYGEMGKEMTSDWDELVRVLKEYYYFTDDMIEEFRGIVRFVRKSDYERN